MSPTKNIYKQIWERAYEKHSITLSYQNKREAQRMRLNLYVGIREYRQDPKIDPDFSRKLEDLELSEAISTDDFGTEYCITIRLKRLNPLAQEAARQLGLLTNEDEGAQS